MLESTQKNTGAFSAPVFLFSFLLTQRKAARSFFLFLLMALLLAGTLALFPLQLQHQKSGC